MGKILTYISNHHAKKKSQKSTSAGFVIEAENVHFRSWSLRRVAYTTNVIVFAKLVAGEKVSLQFFDFVPFIKRT